MKWMLVACLVVLVTASCSVRSGQFAEAEALFDANKCEEAIPAFTNFVNNGGLPGEMRAAYFHRGVCNERLGRLKAAYRDYWITWKIACQTVLADKGYQTDPLAGELVLNSYCETGGPQRLDKLFKRIGEQGTREAIAAGEKELPDEYK